MYVVPRAAAQAGTVMRDVRYMHALHMCACATFTITVVSGSRIQPLTRAAMREIALSLDRSCVPTRPECKMES